MYFNERKGKRDTLDFINKNKAIGLYHRLKIDTFINMFLSERK